MITFTPKRKVKAAGALSLSLMIAAVVIYALSTMDIFAARAVLQLISVIFATAAIFILSKYVITSFAYTVCENDGGGYDLLVSQVSGRKNVTVCRISIGDIKKIKHIKRGDKSCKKAYNYSAELFARELLLLEINDEGSVFYVKLQPDKAFEDMIEEAMQGEKSF